MTLIKDQRQVIISLLWIDGFMDDRFYYDMER